jgi:hypothetical protein
MFEFLYRTERVVALPRGKLAVVDLRSNIFLKSGKNKQAVFFVGPELANACFLMAGQVI